MSVLDVVRSYYDYNAWANSHVLDAAASISDDQFSRDLGASFLSVRGNLSHIAAAQIVWLGRWTGERSDALSLLGDESDFNSIRRAFAKSHEELRAFIASLSTTDLGAESSLQELARYRDREGNNQQARLWQLMLQVVSHGTQHRAEAAMIMTALAKPVRDLDYILFVLERQ